MAADDPCRKAGMVVAGISGTKPGQTEVDRLRVLKVSPKGNGDSLAESLPTPSVERLTGFLVEAAPVMQFGHDYLEQYQERQEYHQSHRIVDFAAISRLPFIAPRMPQDAF